MKFYIQPMQKANLQTHFIIALLLWMAGTTCLAQPNPEAFTSWTFDEAVAPQYWYGTSFVAEYGDFSNAILYADGTYGSSQFATVTTSNYAQMLKNDWAGTELGDPREDPYDGYCLGFKHPNSAHRSFVMSTPTTLYTSISLRYAITRSNTGFKKITFMWSTDGSNYHYIQEKPCDALDFEVQTINLEHIAELENQPMVYIRVTIDSILSTAYQGNIKFDNLTFMGYKCMDTLVLHDTIFSGDNYYENGFTLQEVSGDGEYLYQRRIHFTNQCDSLYQLFLYVNDTTTPPEPPVDPEDTVSVQEIASYTPNIYPNPFKDQLTLEFDPPITANSIYIYNSVGQLVSNPLNHNISPLSGKFTIDTKHWPAGIYFVHITGPTPILQKVIKSSE